MIDYSNKVMKLGITILELLSEALGLNPNLLKDIGCADGLQCVPILPSMPRTTFDFGQCQTHRQCIPHSRFTRPIEWPSSPPSKSMGKFFLGTTIFNV